ncbi:MAG TPA: PHP domain-containing protein [Bacteroidales bacterium]|nr:PHP domain-containing protein [Bacteroidales bacterium]
MKIYKADLHIHTVLSPCGDLSMSPVNIISEAVRKGIEIIGITDHNSTRHCKLVSRLAAAHGIFTMMGAEVTTREEVHCLAFFENTDTLDLFQEYLDEHLPDIRNIPEFFGDQVQVDEKENIIYTEERMLANALDISLEEIESFVHCNDGIFIPAHIDRQKNAIYSQLGFIPAGLKAEALEVSWRNSRNSFAEGRSDLAGYNLITNSDAHLPESIGRAFTEYWLAAPSFKEMKLAFLKKGERRIER